MASLDETLPQSGMQNASNLDREIWAEFFRALFVESKTLTKPTEGPTGFHEEVADEYVYEGTSLDRFGITKQRSRQDFFRTMVLSAYDFRCAITGIEQPELLVAGHIKPWALEVGRRLDPTNGICLNRLHDRAFDRGLITFEDDGRMVTSPQLRSDTREKILQLANAPALKMPRRFLPDRDLLRFHREHVFRDSA
ncbi:MAG: HNH endonuclease [Rhizobiaceae bacterium]